MSPPSASPGRGARTLHSRRIGSPELPPPRRPVRVRNPVTLSMRRHNSSSFPRPREPSSRPLSHPPHAHLPAARFFPPLLSPDSCSQAVSYMCSETHLSFTQELFLQLHTLFSPPHQTSTLLNHLHQQVNMLSNHPSIKSKKEVPFLTPADPQLLVSWVCCFPSPHFSKERPQLCSSLISRSLHRPLHPSLCSHCSINYVLASVTTNPQAVKS